MNKKLIFSIVGIVVALVVSFGVVYLNWVSPLALIIFWSIVIFLGIVIGALIFLTSRMSKKPIVLGDGEQKMNVEDARKFALALVSKRYVEFIIPEEDVVFNLGTSSKKTPIYRLNGIGDLTKKKYTVLVNLNDFEKKNTVIVEKSEKEIREFMEMLAVHPQSFDKRVVRKLDPLTKEQIEVEETTVQREEDAPVEDENKAEI